MPGILIRAQPRFADGDKYKIDRPLATHWRVASCEEVECQNYLNGFILPIDESSDLGQRQAAYLRNSQTRHFTERHGDGGITLFVFERGTRCFAVHKLPRDEPPNFLQIRPMQGVQRQPFVEWAERYNDQAERINVRIRSG